MSDHLSPAQFAACIVHGPAEEELKHINACPKCGAALDEFRAAMASFRSAVRDRVNARMDTVTIEGSSSHAARQPTGAPRSSWILAAAAVVLVIGLPVLISKRLPHPPTSTVREIDPDTLMDAIDLHLLRTVPAPMEPMLGLLPDAGFKTDFGGVQ